MTGYNRDFYSLVPMSLMCDPKRSAGAKMTYILIKTCRDLHEIPDRDHLAELLGCKVKSVTKYTKELQESGWIDIVRTGRENEYILHEFNEAMTT